MPNLGGINITTVDILQKCHQNMTVYNVLIGEQDQGLSFFNPDKLGLENEISAKLFEFENLVNTIETGISKLKEIKEQIKDISVDKEISDLELVKKSVEEIHEIVEGLSVDDK